MTAHRIATPADDDALDALIGAVVPSEVARDVVYRIAARVGEGAMSVALYALRTAEGGESPVVVKVLRPSFVRQLGGTAGLTILKEAVALGRLNERIPPTPFVVRFIDTGKLPVLSGDQPLDLPYVIVEYVHGGAEGTTLTERVERSITTTGAAFDAARAAHLVECLGAGLDAVHEMGVIHRDVKPENVLCCGFGDDEIFKVADFGVARPAGVAATFAGMMVGTLNYAAPELAAMDQRALGPWTDVFGLACIVFYALTGETYFTVRSPADTIVAACNPVRRSIRGRRWLSPDLAAREQACRSIDFALACATSAKIENRPQTASALAAMLVPWLRTEPRSPRALARRLDRIRDPGEATRIEGWTWTALRHPGTTGRVVRCVAWDGDGRCMAATNEGLSFWNGSDWQEASLEGLPNPTGIRLVRRVAPGRWIVGGDDATFATYTSDGIVDVKRIRGASARFDWLSGELDDLAVLVGTAPGEPPTLCALSARRWLKPLPLPDVAVLSSLARIEDARWLLSGRGVDGRGYAAIYAPLDWEVDRLPESGVRAFLACAGQPERKLGITTGASGAVLTFHEGTFEAETIPGGMDLSAVSIDPSGRGWAAGAGRIWHHRLITTADDPAPVGRWDCVWSDPSWTAPFVSLFTDVGVTIAMTADGGIIEGRARKAPARAS